MINIAKTIDLAVLKPNRSMGSLTQACKLARKHKMTSVCVRPTDVARTQLYLYDSDVLTSTVVGFPHGGQVPAVRMLEATQAIEAGAQELDVVMDIAAFLDDRYNMVELALTRLIRAVKNIPIKVIIETGYLNSNEIIKASKLVEESGAAYVKSCTGFGPRGVTPSDINLMLKAVSIPVKASGGIKTKEQALGFLGQGCKRLGIGWESIEEVLKNEDC